MLNKDKLSSTNSKDVPGEEGFFPFYNTFKHGSIEWNQMMQSKYGDVWSSRIFSGILIIVEEFEIIRQIFSKQENQLKMSYLPSTQTIMGSDSLLFLEGEEHRAMRKILNPVFDQSSISLRMDYIRRAAKESMGKFVTKDKDEIVAAWDFVKWYLSKVVVWILFGQELQDKRLEEFANQAYELTDGAFDLFNFNLPFTRFGKAMRARKAVTTWIDELICSQDTLSPDCILKTLLDTKDQNGRPLSRKAIEDTVMLLIVAGISTTRDAATKIIQNLATHPNVANKLQEELDNVDLEQCTPSEIGNLKYLDGVVRETLRLDPPVGAVVRQAVEDMDVGEYIFPKDTVLFFHLYQAWKTDPMFSDMQGEMSVNNFCPDRWSVPLNKEKGQYFPFGLGIHSCIGLHLAQLEMKLLIASLVQNYHWELVQNGQNWYEEGVLEKPRDGLPIKLNKRQLKSNQKPPTYTKSLRSVAIQARACGVYRKQYCSARFS